MECLGPAPRDSGSLSLDGGCECEFETRAPSDCDAGDCGI